VKLPPAMTPGQIPRNGTFDVVFWPEDNKPYLVRGLRANTTVGLTHSDSGRAFGFATVDSGRLWAAIFYDDLVAAWERQCQDKERGP